MTCAQHWLQFVRLLDYITYNNDNGHWWPQRDIVQTAEAYQRRHCQWLQQSADIALSIFWIIGARRNFSRGGKTARTGKTDLFFSEPKARTKIFAIVFDILSRIYTKMANTQRNFAEFSRELLLHNYTLVSMDAVYTKSESSPRTRREKNHLQNVARACANNLAANISL